MLCAAVDNCEENLEEGQGEAAGGNTLTGRIPMIESLILVPGICLLFSGLMSGISSVLGMLQSQAKARSS